MKMSVAINYDVQHPHNKHLGELQLTRIMVKMSVRLNENGNAENKKRNPSRHKNYK